MKKRIKLLASFLAAVIFITAMLPSAFAKNFAVKFDGNIGVQTQYAYSENDASWLRKLVIKEDMLSAQGISTAAVLHPVTSYPYTSDAPHFKAQVEECVKTYTLDEESQRAAYLYLLNQIGALTVISEPTVSNETKADWLRQNGIVVTAEDEADAERVLMISALYAMMRNDLYYVYKGEHLEIPQGTPMEEALVMYIAALSGNNKSLAAFMIKFFGSDKLGSLEDYIYYTSLMSLYTNGYISVSEIPTIERKEVFRRVAIMTIRGYGISIDSENATQEELTKKYLTAMLGSQYDVSLDAESLVKAEKEQTIPYYILQRMAYQDSNVTISHKKYSYEECFDIVLKKTDRFDLANEFFSDIYEYDIHLQAIRKNISINPTPIQATTSVTINGKSVTPGKYAIIQLTDSAKQTITIVSTYMINNQSTSSTYKLNIYQGVKEPESSNITGIVPTLGTTVDSNGVTQVVVPTPSLPAASPIISNANNAAMNILDNILNVNDKGQLVDQNGNIVAQGNYEQLPEGYKYVVGDDGIIQVALIDSTTQSSSEKISENGLSEDGVRKIVIITSSTLCILLIAALISVLVITKKKNKNKSDVVRARRAKEKAKKARLEAKQAKKAKKDKQ